MTAFWAVFLEAEAQGAGRAVRTVRARATEKQLVVVVVVWVGGGVGGWWWWGREGGH